MAYGRHLSESKKNKKKNYSTAWDDVNETVSDIKDRYKKSSFTISHLIVFPFFLFYEELVLKAFAGSALHFWFLFLFTMSAALLLTAVSSLLPKKVNRIFTLVIMFVFCFYFTMESMLRVSYDVYMNLRTVISGAGGVMTDFAGSLFSAIFFGIPKIIAFFLPLAAYLILGQKHIPSKRRHPLFAAVLAVFSLILFLIGLIAAKTSDYEAIYTDRMDFDASTEVFGLLTGTRLDLTAHGDGDDELVIDDDELPVITTAPVSPSVSPEATDPGTDDPAVTDPGTEDPNPEETPVVTPEPVVLKEHVMDIDLETLCKSSKTTVKEVSQYIAAQTPAMENEYTGLFKGKNLILICAEAFSDAVIDPVLTPTLYRMQHNGFYFSDFYQPTWGGSTSTGEFSMLLGLVPTNSIDSMTDTEGHNLYFSMGNQLQRLGYWSSAYHNGSYTYYDRQKTHKNLGYGQWVAQGNGLEKIAGSWVNDEKMITKTLATYIDKQPFSVYYMTVSGHAAYNKDNDVKVKNNIEYVESILGADSHSKVVMNYICYQMELEKAMASMIAMLEEAGIADDTVVCLCADHYPYALRKSTTWGNSKDQLPDLYGHEIDEVWDRDHNACLLWCGSLENEDREYACEISDPCYSLDILPTLSNLFGLEYDSRMMVGRDVFSDEEPFVMWPNGSFITRYAKYNVSTGTYAVNAAYADQLPEDYKTQMTTLAKNKKAFSKKIISSNYYKVLFGKDTVTDNSNWVPKVDNSGGTEE